MAPKGGNARRGKTKEEKEGATRRKSKELKGKEDRKVSRVKRTT
jgi:hypothetical protein